MNKKFSPPARFLALLLTLPLFGGCAATSGEAVYTDVHPLVILEDEAVALSAAPSPASTAFLAQADGTAVKKCDTAVIDYSHTDNGYVMVQYTAQTTQRLKAQVKGPAVTYTYNINPGEWTVFPLAEGDGDYTVTLYINAKDSKYATVLSQTFSVKLRDEFLPFLYSNQYVDYASAPEAVKKAGELTAPLTNTLDKVAAVYTYVVDTLTYDTEKAQTVQSGYLPVLDRVMEEKKGICFDYAALMAGMLRSQGIPCKLVVGYAGKNYHAWINVWSEEEGWIEGIIRFDGKSWQRMDPTFASSANRSSSIMDYIGDGTNYTEKYLY